MRRSARKVADRSSLFCRRPTCSPAYVYVTGPFGRRPGHCGGRTRRPPGPASRKQQVDPADARELGLQLETVDPCVDEQGTQARLQPRFGVRVGMAERPARMWPSARTAADTSGSTAPTTPPRCQRVPGSTRVLRTTTCGISSCAVTSNPWTDRAETQATIPRVRAATRRARDASGRTKDPWPASISAPTRTALSTRPRHPGWAGDDGHARVLYAPLHVGASDALDDLSWTQRPERRTSGRTAWGGGVSAGSRRGPGSPGPGRGAPGRTRSRAVGPAA